MFAIFKTGGKQYKVSKGDVLEIEKIDASGKVEFDNVMMVDDKIGNPVLKGAKVVAEILEQTKDPKILVFKKIRRKNSKKMNGHKQPLTKIKVVDIVA